MFSYKEMYDEAYDPIYPDANTADWHGALKKTLKKRTTYDDDLLEKINMEKQRKIDEQRERDARLKLPPVPLLDEAKMDTLIKEIHTGISQGETKGVDDFNYYYISGGEKVIFQTVGIYNYALWIKDLQDWVQNAYLIKCKNDKEYSLIRKEVLIGVEQFFQHVCREYNKKHVYSQAKLKEGGIRIVY